VLRFAADDIIAISNGFQAELLQRGIPPARCHLIRNGIDVKTMTLQQRSVRAVVGQLVIDRAEGVDVLSPRPRYHRGDRTTFHIAVKAAARGTAQQRRTALQIASTWEIDGRLNCWTILRVRIIIALEGMPCGSSGRPRRPVVATQVLGQGAIQDGVTGLLALDDPIALSDAILPCSMIELWLTGWQKQGATWSNGSIIKLAWSSRSSRYTTALKFVCRPDHPACVTQRLRASSTSSNPPRPAFAAT
jgi:hypothetical protein